MWNKRGLSIWEVIGGRQGCRRQRGEYAGHVHYCFKMLSLGGHKNGRRDMNVPSRYPRILSFIQHQ